MLLYLYGAVEMSRDRSERKNLKDEFRNAQYNVLK